MPHPTPRRTLAAALAVVSFVAACTGGESTGPAPTAATTTTIAPSPRVDDGTLKFGALIPLNDTLIGATLVTAVEDAVAHLNELGGVLGNDVELIIRDEGNTSATASAGIGALVDEGVDAIIGPSSSLTAIGALDDAVAAQIVTCSPTATSMALDEFPDDRLFFRSIASDSLQAVAIAEQTEVTGARNVAIVHIDDAYGRPYAASVEEALADRPLELVDTIAIAVDDDELADDAQRLLESGATVAILLASAADAGRFLDALGREEFTSLTDVIANDAIRDPVATPVIAGLPPGLRLRITGIAPQITLPRTGEDDTVSQAPFVPQVTDCVNLIALAAVQADSDSPTLIASQMPSVSAGGSLCRTFENCIAQLEDGLQINYNGPTGATELNRDGETSRAFFDTFTFDGSGTDVPGRSFQATT